MEHILALFLLCLFAFSINVTPGQDVCLRPQLEGNIDLDGIQMFFNPGVELALSCQQGYTGISGPRKIVCTTGGKWTNTKFSCIPKRCPHPDPLSNGELHYEDTLYQSTISYTCHEGYTLTGSNTTECLANGTWSTPVPECKLSVYCSLAPIPKFGMISYDRMITGSTTEYGLRGTYKCLPPYVLFGEARAECTLSGTWTPTPECRVVTCPQPENIERGYMSTNKEGNYDYMETIKYGCNGDYVLEGSLQIVCQQNGQWSEKPSCKAPCTVDIQKGRILYRGQKIWIEGLKSKRVLHKEVVSVYCLNEARNCGYAVETQCINGKLEIPNCFEEPSTINYNSSSLPSEIEQC